MSNMSYCRFQNTSSDFADCCRNIYSLEPSSIHENSIRERQARARLIRDAVELLADLGLTDSDQHDVDAVIYQLDQGEGYEPEEY